MNQDNSLPDPSLSDPDDQSEDVMGTDQLATLLSDAFDVPPVPASLSRKIDRGLQSHWGSYQGDQAAADRCSSIAASRIAFSTQKAVIKFPATCLASGCRVGPARSFWQCLSSTVHQVTHGATMLDAIAGQEIIRFGDEDSLPTALASPRRSNRRK